jgi:hypothetical protein
MGPARRAYREGNGVTMETTTMRFVLDFKDGAVGKAGDVLKAIEEMSLGELLYRVLFGDAVQQAQG